MSAVLKTVFYSDKFAQNHATRRSSSVHVLVFPLQFTRGSNHN